MRLIRSKFEQWLKKQPPENPVGLIRDGCGCPLVRFYNEASGCEVSICSDGEYLKIDRGYHKARLPTWANMFAFLVDNEPGFTVTASRALAILEKIAA